MSDKAFKTAGTQLYFVDTVTDSSPQVQALTCPTGITGINAGTSDRIDTTCLDNTTGTRTYKGGFSDAGEVTAPFILEKGDESHKALFDLKKSGDVVGWLVGLSDSTAAPTLGTDDSLVRPAARTTLEFDGYVSGVTIDAATNEVIRGTLTIQSSGPALLEWGV
jgi:Phage tail tube, TTP, lambda-like